MTNFIEGSGVSATVIAIVEKAGNPFLGFIELMAILAIVVFIVIFIVKKIKNKKQTLLY